VINGMSISNASLTLRKCEFCISRSFEGQTTNNGFPRF